MSQVTIQGVTVETITKGRNSYQVANVVYTNGRGENKEKKIMSFSNPAVFAIAQKLQAGQVVEVALGDPPYYNWVSVTQVGADAPVGAKVAAAATGGKVVGSTYETAEERKLKQMLIVKQSSIGSAIEYLKHDPANRFSISEVIDTAQAFVDYVYNTEQTLAEMPNDIPF
jgi:phage-related minor tail protein